MNSWTNHQRQIDLESQLRERNRELACLYAVSRDANTIENPADFYRGLIHKLELGMRFPNEAAVILELLGDTYRSDKLTERHTRRLEAILQDGSFSVGKLSVCYPPECQFLVPEEQRLLQSVSEIVFRYAERDLEKQRDQVQLSSFRAQSHQLKDYFANLAAAVVVHGAGTEIVFANAIAGELLGIRLDLMLGKRASDPVWHFIDEQKRRLSPEEYPVNNVIRSNRPLQDMVLGVVHPDRADVTWVLVNGAPIFGPDRTLAEVLISFVDITGERAASRRLQESEQKFRSVFEQAAMGIARVSPKGSWLEVNDKLCEIVGFSRDELLQKTFQQITHPDDLDADLAFVSQMLAGERQSYSMEKRYIKKGGDLVWVNLTVSLTRDASGQPSYFVSIVEDISLRKQYEEALKYRASHDTLTGLNSRFTVLETLDSEFKRALRYGRSLSLLMIDIDHFKRINDIYGHQAGDEVLKAVSATMLATVRESDTVGRYGGEEFLIILPELALEQARLMAERVRREIANVVIHYGTQQIKVTVSVGVATGPVHGDQPDLLITQADNAMYAAKQAGRNRCRSAITPDTGPGPDVNQTRSR